MVGVSYRQKVCGIREASNGGRVHHTCMLRDSQIKKIYHVPTSLHNGSPYVHGTGLTNHNTSTSQIHN